MASCVCGLFSSVVGASPHSLFVRMLRLHTDQHVGG